MDLAAFIILTGHFCLLLLLCLYGAHRVRLTWLAKKLYRTELPKQRFDTLPTVTVQLPVYNEKFVVERLIAAVAGLDYPSDKLQIQVLDDSTDETRDIIARQVRKYREQGLWIDHIHRVDRQGFKAGALSDAMDKVRGDFIAIFDADFLPTPDFLMNSIHHLADPGVGMVQTRWSHLNRTYSLLTNVQAIMLDAHFAIEQVARFKFGAFFNFNGTAGIWRKTAIEASGGWQADTITEDLDLSYRAQLRGWKFTYLRDVKCPSELPINMNAFKSQQHRWAKGAIEVMKKTLVPLWKAPVPLRSKIEGSLHLTSNLSYMLMLIDSLFFLLPSIFIYGEERLDLALRVDFPLLLLATFSHIYFFMVGQKLLFGKVRDKLLYVPLLLATSIGLSINNGRAVLEALLGHKSGFVRTPKLGKAAIDKSVTAISKNAYANVFSKWGDMVELGLSLFYAAFLSVAIYNELWMSVPILSIFTAGFLFVGSKSFRERKRKRVRANRL